MTFAIVSRKGGVGKSATALNLAHCLSTGGRAVLLDTADYPDWHLAELGLRNPRAEQPLPLAPPLRARRGGWGGEVLVLDCPAHADDHALASAIAAAELILVPTPPDIQALEQAARIIEAAPAKARILFSLIHRNWRLHRDFIAQVRRSGHPVCKTVIHYRSAVQEAKALGLPVGLTRPRSPAAREFADLTKEVLRLATQAQKQA